MSTLTYNGGGTSVSLAPQAKLQTSQMELWSFYEIFRMSGSPAQT